MLTHRNTYTVTGSLGPTTPWKGKSALRIPGLTQSQRGSVKNNALSRRKQNGGF